MKVGKQQRHYRITRILEEGVVSSQAQIVDMLAAEGIEATQATVSRDLEELGAVKVRLPGGDRAIALPDLPAQQVAPVDHLRRMMGEWVVDVACNDAMVVLRTPPGCAHVVASALDRSGLESTIGTVAGDDTVLVVVAGGQDATAVAAELAAMAGLAEQ